MKRKRHNLVAEGFSEGVQIIRKLRTAEQLLNQDRLRCEFLNIELFASLWSQKEHKSNLDSEAPGTCNLCNFGEPAPKYKFTTFSG